MWLHVPHPLTSILSSFAVQPFMVVFSAEKNGERLVRTTWPMQNYYVSVKMVTLSIFCCCCDQTGEAVVGHVLRILLMLQMPRWLYHLEGHPLSYKLIYK